MTNDETIETLAAAFSAPFNWCDMRCERCPLASRCPLPRREAQRNWVRSAGRAGPNPFDEFLQDLITALARALPELRRRAEAEAIDLDAPLPKLPLALDALRLQNAGMALVDSIASFAREGPRTPGGDALVRNVFLLTTKSARIAGHLDVDTDSTIWWHDGAPVLLLLSRLKRDARANLCELESQLDPAVQRAAEAALSELDRILDPLIVTIGGKARLVLEQLVRASRAPSPFCTLSELKPGAPP